MFKIIFVYCLKYKFIKKFLKNGAINPEPNKARNEYCTIVGQKYKASPVQALKQSEQLKGLISSFHFL